jgi:hypothetical protein
MQSDRRPVESRGVVYIGGMPSSGKTTLARALRSVLPCYANVDDTIKLAYLRAAKELALIEGLEFTIALRALRHPRYRCYYRKHSLGIHASIRNLHSAYLLVQVPTLHAKIHELFVTETSEWQRSFELGGDELRSEETISKARYTEKLSDSSCARYILINPSVDVLFARSGSRYTKGELDHYRDLYSKEMSVLPARDVFILGTRDVCSNICTVVDWLRDGHSE